MSKVEFKPKETKKSKEALKGYFDDEFLKCKNGCKHFDSCRKGFRKNKERTSFNDCIRIGKYYDTIINDKPLRILVIGIEGIFTEGQNFDKKNNGDFRLSNECNNHHIVGTLETLLRIYKAKDEVQEYWEDHMINKNDILYDSYALTNAFKCVFKSENTENNDEGPKNKKMFQNCFTHLIREIKELAPTIIITQGRWSDRYNNLFIKTLMNEEMFISQGKIKEAAADGYDNLGLYEFKYNNRPMYVLLSLHPARIRGNHDKLKAVQYKQLEYLRLNGVIPKESVLREYIIAHEKEELSDLTLNSEE